MLTAAAVSAGVTAGARLAPDPVLAAPGETVGAGPPAVTPAVVPAGGDGAVEVTLKVNGRVERLRLDPRTTLLDAVRDTLGLTGTKKGCDHGQCGSCTVHVAGRPVLSCLILAVSADSAEVTTIEGLARGREPHPMQRAFEDRDALQCGFCTPGMIMSAVALVEDGHDHSYEEIREHLSGNLCRCGAYPNIVDAVRTARKRAG